MRHRLTPLSKHTDNPTLFECEFCGKASFTRSDNRNTHRKLHAKKKDHNRGIKFIPAAVSAIERETVASKLQGSPNRKSKAKTIRNLD